jgi:hypothetical protein
VVSGVAGAGITESKTVLIPWVKLTDTEAATPAPVAPQTEPSTSLKGGERGYSAGIAAAVLGKR